MGIFYKIVNPVKMEYLDPLWFGEGMKFNQVLRGDFALLALKWLLRDDIQQQAASGIDTFAGRWLGDPVILAGDDSGLPNAAGIATTTESDPDRNLYFCAREEMQDLSVAAVAFLCSRGAEQELVEAARQTKTLFVTLGLVADQYGPEPLLRLLNKTWGSGWRKQYQAAWDGSPGKRRPVPPIVESLRG